VGGFVDVFGEVGVDAAGYFAEEFLEVGGGVEVFGIVGFAVGGFMGFMSAATGFVGAMAGGFGVVEADFMLGDAGFEFVEFSVEDTNLAKISAFEGFEFDAEIG
jgi:hypothetical protein